MRVEGSEDQAALREVDGGHRIDQPYPHALQRQGADRAEAEAGVSGFAPATSSACIARRRRGLLGEGMAWPDRTDGLAVGERPVADTGEIHLVRRQSEVELLLGDEVEHLGEQSRAVEAHVEFRGVDLDFAEVEGARMGHARQGLRDRTPRLAVCARGDHAERALKSSSRAGPALKIMPPAEPSHPRNPAQGHPFLSGLAVLWSLMKQLAQEGARAEMLRASEEVFRRRRFEDFPFVHKDDAVGHLPCEAHLVGDRQHGHAVAR